MEFTTHDAVKLDKNGNIDTKVLEKELVESLKFDITYKQQDNMKKRAVKQAPSYDDFKNMVACAHLKKVTKQNINMLIRPGPEDPDNGIPVGPGLTRGHRTYRTELTEAFMSERRSAAHLMCCGLNRSSHRPYRKKLLSADLFKAL